MPRALWRVVLWGWVVFHGRGTPVGPSLYTSRTIFSPFDLELVAKDLERTFPIFGAGAAYTGSWILLPCWVGRSVSQYGSNIFSPCGSNITVCLTFGYEYPLRPSKREVNRRMMNRNVTYRYVRNVRNFFGALVLLLHPRRFFLVPPLVQISIEGCEIICV